MSYHLGVDVGTTYTAAAIGRDGRAEAATLGTRSVSIPSVIHLAGDRLLVGEPAARRAVTDPGRIAREFKRRVGDPTPLLIGGSPVSAELCMARVVEWVVAQVSATEGSAPASLALTHPANWGEYKLDLLRQALRHLDLTVDRFVPEPVAAATAYAAQRSLPPGTVVAVYDLGGGTFDAALVRAGGSETTGIAGRGSRARIIGRPDGIERLGGIDFDQSVYRHVLASIGLDLDRFDPDDARTLSGLAQLREECVDAKEALSYEADVSIPVMLPDRHTEVRLTRSELETMIRPALDETLVALRRTIASAQLRVEDVATVLLVGGSSRIPLVAQLVTHELGLPVAVDARPKDAISIGAAMVAMSATPRASAGAAIRGGLASPVLVGAAGPRTTATPASTGLAAAGATGTSAPGGAFPPAGGGPAPATPGAGRRRALVGVAAAIGNFAAVLVGLVATRDDDPQAAAGDDPPTAASDDQPHDEDDDPSTAITAEPLTDLGGLGGLGALGGQEGSDEPPPDPLPGDGWSPEARTAFVEGCSASAMGNQASMLGVDGAVLCGCVYDDMSTETAFATFNEQWASDDFDPNSEFGQILTDAVLGCAMSGA